MFPLWCDSTLAGLCLADSLVPHTRAVSPLLAKDAAGTPKVPAPVVHEGGRAMLPHNLIADIGKETETAADKYRNGDRDGDRGKQRGERERQREREREREREKKKKRVKESDTERERERETERDTQTETETDTDKEGKGRERMKKTKKKRQRERERERESTQPYTRPIYPAFLDLTVEFSVSLFLSF